MTTKLPSEPVTFVVAVSNRLVLERNLLASPALREDENHEVLFQEGKPSAAKAYNDAIDQSKNDLIVFLHQDIYLPSGWLLRLRSCIAALEHEDSQWAVAGCWGATQGGDGWGHVYTPGIGVMGSRFQEPQRIQTLDEIVLIMRKSRGLRFDSNLPHFHLYGTDLCLNASRRGLRSYAVSAFCIHNSNYLRVLPPEFYECYHYVKRKWRAYLPICTPCIRISRFDANMRQRRVREAYNKLRGRFVGQCRSDNPSQLYEHLQKIQAIV